MTCWQTATSPQCLRVESADGTHLLPYGYFQHAKYSRADSKEVILLTFGQISVRVKGKKLDELLTAISRFGVEQIKVLPEKYSGLSSEGVICEIKVQALGNATSENT